MTQKRKILIVDDEEAIRILVQETMQEAGYDTIVAANGEEALAKLSPPAKEMPDLIILDIMMPGMNGYEVLRILRQQSNIPVIMLTAKKETTSTVEALSLGADDYVRKPFMKDELLARIRTKLRRAGTKPIPPAS